MYTEPTQQEIYYHIWNHSEQVETAAIKIAQLEGITNSEINMLRAGAILHDVGNLVAREDHEKRGAKLAQYLLPIYGGSSDEIDTISGLIMATKMPFQPSSHLHKIIIDADMSPIGLKNWIEIIDGYRQEIGMKELDDWYKGQKNFLESHSWQTSSAKNLYDNQKMKNVEHLQSLYTE